MAICFSVTNLSLGGAQVFVLRLASAIAAMKQETVYVYDHWPEGRHRGILSLASERVRVISYCENAVLRAVIWRANGLLRRLFPKMEFRDRLNRRAFRKKARRYDFRIVNSHMSASDFLLSQDLLPGYCRFFITLHGEYELLMQTQDRRVLREKVEAAMRRAEKLIYTADKNLEAVKELARDWPQTRKIGVGLDTGISGRVPMRREDHGIRTEDLVIGLVSRGIPEKGWDAALRITQNLRRLCDRRILLVFVGDGTYLKDLVAAAKDPDLLLMQFEKDYAAYSGAYSLFDLFLFPTRFEGESYPNVVMESLCRQVPVFSYEYAEIPAMLRTQAGTVAGGLVRKGDEAALTALLAETLNEPGRLPALKAECAAAAEKFSIAAIAGEYLRLWQ